VRTVRDGPIPCTDPTRTGPLNGRLGVASRLGRKERPKQVYAKRHFHLDTFCGGGSSGVDSYCDAKRFSAGISFSKTVSLALSKHRRIVVDRLGQ